MDRICLLKNTIQQYAWGSKTAIPAILGAEATDAPQAELWMGAHPKAPSQVRIHNKWILMTDLIAAHPQDVLGAEVSVKYNGRLPYLFKILAAEAPLSIQAHPSRVQAGAGFNRENALNIALNAFNRNYKDDNHKPECICALTDFWALNGFRKISDIAANLTKLCPVTLASETAILKKFPDPKGLKDFFQRLMTRTGDDVQKIVTEAVTQAHGLSQTDPVGDWVGRLYRHYPDDVGVLSPGILNLVCLKPGQALFLPAGRLHAYLDGVGLELMANSDNVLRGGLTPKHIDVDELLSVLVFQETDIDVIAPVKTRPGEYAYCTPAEEFSLSKLIVDAAGDYLSPSNRSIDILICLKGEASLQCPASRQMITVTKGDSVMIPAAAGIYRITGSAELYRATVPKIKKGLKKA